MKIHTISVDHFGIWDGLKLQDLSHSVNLVYGCNEAGKTTLMQFLRAMFYGTAADGRAGYLEQEASSGQLEVETRTGHFEICRQFRIPERRGEFVTDRIAVTSPGAPAQGAHALQVLLSGVDEAIYRNVYAVGQKEMQELGALSDTDAANYLYDLSAGLDRVSLVDVLRRLRRAREALIGTDSEPCEIGRLIGQRQEILEELKELAEALGRYRTLAAERSQIALHVVKMQEELEFLTGQVRTFELACSLREKWQLLQDVRKEREKMGCVLKMTPEDILRIDRLTQEALALQALRTQVASRRTQLREQAQSLPVHANFGSLIAKIEALRDQRSWIASVLEGIGKLEEEADRLVAGEPTADDATGENSKSAFEVAMKAGEAMPQLRQFARSLKEARSRLKATKQQAGQSAEPADPNARQRASAAEKLEAATTQIAALERRIHLEARLQKMADQRSDLDLLREGLLDQKVLSPRVIIVSGGLFVLGVMLAAAGLFLFQASGLTGIVLASVGIAGSAGGVWLKKAMEKAYEREFEACERQQALLADQEQKANEQCRELEKSLSLANGPYSVQLHQAKNEAAALEQELEREQKHQIQMQGAADAEAAASEAKAGYQIAVRQWHRALHEVGLPANLSPAKVRQLAKQSQSLLARGQEGDLLRADADRRRSELAAIKDRVDELLSLAGLSQQGSSLLEKVDTLLAAASEQKQLLAKRNAMRRKGRKLSRRYFEANRELAQLHRERRDLLSSLGIDSASDPQSLADRYATSQRLEQEAAGLDAAIDTAVAGVCDRKQLDEELAAASAEQIEKRRERCATKLEKVNAKLTDAYEQRGRLGEQLLSLGNDRRHGILKLELASVEKKLTDAIVRWKDLAVTTCLLESIRRCYEQQRQPAALQEASLYMERLTDGRYVRIWTRLDEDSLCVDDGQGHPWPVDRLSSGTREQLFLALRLSLVTQYAQRGIRLPLVLDDVLVHFDAQRAKAASRVLRDFADLGHQIFVFTCHEHIVKMFKAIKAEVRELPDCRQSQKVEAQVAEDSLTVSADASSRQAVADEFPEAEPSSPESEPSPEESDADSKNQAA